METAQTEVAAHLRQIDQDNLEKVLAMVDNSIITLSSRIYTLDNIVPSVIDIVQNEVSVLYHGQNQLRSVMQFSWTLQTPKSGKGPWDYLNTSALFLPFNLTEKQKLMSMKDATYTMLHNEKLEQLPFSIAETNSAVCLIDGLFHCSSHFSTSRSA